MSDELENLGKLGWEIVKSNRPVVHKDSDFVNAVPKGVEWADLSAPLGTNHHYWTWYGPGLLIKDFYFQMALSWTYGAHYKGGGAYITNATVTVLNHDVGIGGYDIHVACKIGHIENVGSEKAPNARIPIDVSLDYTNWFFGGGTAKSFAISGSGSFSEN